MKRTMMLAVLAVLAGMLFVGCKNDKKGAPAAQETATTAIDDLAAINPGDPMDWETLSREYAASEEIAVPAFEEEEMEEPEELEGDESEIDTVAEEEIPDAEKVEIVVEDAAEEEAAPAEYFAVAQKPGFNGGDANAFSKWVAQNMTYPEAARQEEVEGVVVVKFTIGTSGAVRSAHVVKSSGDPRLDAAAVRTIAKAPKWEPGYDSEGKPVSTNLTMPVVFKLQH